MEGDDPGEDDPSASALFEELLLDNPHDRVHDSDLVQGRKDSGNGVNGFDEDDDFFQELSGHAGHAGDNNATASGEINFDDRLVAEPMGEGMYGPVQALLQIGSCLQKNLFDAFRKVSQGSVNEAEKEKLRKVNKQLVEERLIRSKRSEAKATDLPESTLRSRSKQYACALIYCSAWLVGAFFRAWINLFTNINRRWKAVAVISVMKYDETPLRLNLNSWKSFLGGDPPPERIKKRKVRDDLEKAETYCHAKILAVQWRYGFLSFHFTYSRFRVSSK